MTRFRLIAYFATLIAFLAIDSVWLTTMAGVLYRPYLEGLLREKPDLVAAAAFYLIYAGGLLAFAVEAGRRNDSWRAAALAGAFFGFCAYATYDLTNQATLAAWSPVLTLADLVWGTILSAVASAIGFSIARRFVPAVA